MPKLLARAFAASDPAERLRLCREAVALDAGIARSRSSRWRARCRENRDGAAAREALDRAAALAPDWEAVAYESGKLSLVYDDMAQARDAFQRAADLMPTFSAAFSNLGATLGELGEPARGARAPSARRWRTIRAASPFSTTSASSAASWDGSTNRRRRSAA